MKRSGRANGGLAVVDVGSKAFMRAAVKLSAVRAVADLFVGGPAEDGGESEGAVRSEFRRVVRRRHICPACGWVARYQEKKCGECGTELKMRERLKNGKWVDLEAGG
jgi:ribosomal protein S27AE